MSDHDVTHKEIYDRLLQVEAKVTRIDDNTAGMVTAFKAAEGAFTVLEWLAKLAKPILYIGAAITAAGIVWQNLRVK